MSPGPEYGPPEPSVTLARVTIDMEPKKIELDVVVDPARRSVADQLSLLAELVLAAPDGWTAVWSAEPLNWLAQ